MSNTNKAIARVFPRRTRATPNDGLAFVDCQPPLLTLPNIDEVHISITFSWDIKKAERLYDMWKAVGVPIKMGGPAFLEPSGEFEPGMYIKRGYTITSRGCQNNCWFCSVPKREKGLREMAIKDGWNVLDDNLLACSDPHVEAVFSMLSRQKERVVFTGGLDAELLKPWHARRMRELKARHMFFAYDTPDGYEPLVDAGRIMLSEGHTVAANSMRCYVLIGYPNDTFSKAEKRLTDTVTAGFMPFAMLYRDEVGKKDVRWARFQREWLNPQIVGTKMKSIRGKSAK